MNIKLTILSSAILAGMSAVASAGSEPPPVPGIYSGGVTSPLVASTDLSLAERTAYANYEAVMQIAEARIHAYSCNNAAGEFSLTAFSDGSIGNPSQNFATVLSNGSSFTVRASSNAEDPDDRGQLISVNGDGTLTGKAVQNYHADLAYNGVNNMMDSVSHLDIVSINGRFDRYFGKVIKDFYRGAIDDSSSDFFNIFDWGLQSLDKLGYPVNKYWQRSKSHRDNGTNGRTVFVKDRLVGATNCRIIIDTKGFNNQDFFQQSGKLKIQTGVNPGAPVVEFGQAPF